MSPNLKKYLQLAGIGIGVSSLVLAWQWFSNPIDASIGLTKEEPQEETATTPSATNPAPVATEEPIPEKYAQKEDTGPSLQERLSQIQTNTDNPYESAYTGPPKPATKPTVATPTKPATKGSPRKSGSSGGGSGGGSNGGSGAASGGGNPGESTAVLGGDGSSKEETPQQSTDNYWHQTGPDPRRETLPEDRHNTSCPKYRNVPGEFGGKERGNPCPICGG